MVLYLVSAGLLGLSLNALTVSAAYAIWSGLGTALIVRLGIFVLGEALTWSKFFSSR